MRAVTIHFEPIGHVLPDVLPETPDTPLLSIIVPARDGYGPLLNNLATRDKVLADRIEWILVDDQSAEILSESLPTSIYTIRCWRNPSSLGAGESRNIGLSLAHGQYVLFFDADDILDSANLMNLLPVLESGFYDLIICSYLTDRNTGEIRKMNRDDTDALETIRASRDPYDIFRLTHFSWNRIVRRSLMNDNNIRFQDTDVNNDLYAVWKMTESSSSILMVDRPVCTYSNMPRQNRLSGINDDRRMQLFIPLRALYRESRDDPRLMEALFRLSWKNKDRFNSIVSRRLKKRFLGFLFLHLRRFPRNVLNDQPFGTRLLLFHPTVFRFAVVFHSRCRKGLDRFKRKLLAVLPFPFTFQTEDHQDFIGISE